jgi:hypothetical protein
VNAAQLQATGELAATLTHPAPGPSALDLPHGLHYGVPEDQYHRKVFGLASKHMLDLFATSPLTYKTYCDMPAAPEETPEHFLIGNATGCAMFEPERFAATYACEPDFGYVTAHAASGTTKERGAANKARRDAWRAAHNGHVLLSERQYRDVTAMAAAVRAHPRVAALLAKGTESEVTVRWRDAETGLECKARWDLWCAHYCVILDGKTTQDAAAEAFELDAEKYGYADQAAMYLEGARVLGIDRGPFLFAVVQKPTPQKPAPLNAVYGMDESWLAAAAARVRRRMRRLADCIARDVWAGLPEHIQTLQRPRWARDRD